MNSDDLDVNRVRVFRQLKKEIRGSKDYLIVGIDIAKDKHNAPICAPRIENIVFGEQSTVNGERC